MALLACHSSKPRADVPQAGRYGGTEPGHGGPRGQRPGSGEMFERLDTNRDGRVSRREMAAMPRPPQSRGRGNARGFDPDKLFDRLDRNRDGYITRDELPGGGPRR